MISIQLENNQQVFQPGDTITGIVRWKNLHTPLDRVELRLIWFTRGKGNLDVGVHDSRTFEHPLESDQQEFHFVAPEEPYSFSGKLISLIWAIEAIAFPSQEAAQVEIVVAPEGKEILLHLGDAQSTASSSSF
ncbi:MAG: hypothetical protein KatS3mg111_0495 [Pirellulaceae bacterium]|nr:MAG: hypothetical protein KatS3mg111_0495 [Pirellulaceae bacterium]